MQNKPKLPVLRTGFRKQQPIETPKPLRVIWGELLWSFWLFHLQNIEQRQCININFNNFILGNKWIEIFQIFYDVISFKSALSTNKKIILKIIDSNTFHSLKYQNVNKNLKWFSPTWFQTLSWSAAIASYQFCFFEGKFGIFFTIYQNNLYLFVLLKV